VVKEVVVSFTVQSLRTDEIKFCRWYCWQSSSEKRS